MIAALVHDRIARSWRWCTDFLCSHDGKPSNPKLMGWSILAAFVLNRPIPVTVVAILIASSFGIKTFQMWLQKATFAASSTDSVKLELTKHITQVVQERRNVTDGLEPAP